MFFSFITIHAFDKRTDGWTDGFTIANTPLRTMQGGKNEISIVFELEN